jgi:hypothetical protein
VVRARVLVAVAIASCARTGPAPVTVTKSSQPAATARAPIAAWFGQWRDEDDTFERKTRFDRVDGESFGWRIKLRCTGPVRFREVMRLPSPGDWTFTPEEMPGTTISSDSTTTTTIDYAACKQGWIEHVWNLAAEDPAGTYVITVEIEGYATQTFRPRFVDVDR